MSKGPSFPGLTENPLCDVSNCMDEQPQSIKPPSILFSGILFSLNNFSTSENLPRIGINLPLIKI